MKLRAFLVLTVIGLSWAQVGVGQGIDAAFEEDFESTEPFNLPPGWEEINETDPVDGSFQAGETTNLALSSELEGWTVLSQELLASIDGNRVNVPGVVTGNSMYSESDKRGGLQFMFLYTPVIDLTGRDNILLRFDSNYTQNQDNIAYAEYTLQGNLANDDANKIWLPIFYWVDSPEVTAANGNAIDLMELNMIDDGADPYDVWIEADLDSIDIETHVEGRLNDNQTSSKLTETFPLPDAANQRNVQVKFFHGGGASWYWGIDNIVVGSELTGLNAPNTPTLSVDPASPSFLGDVTFVGSAYSHPDGAEHRNSNLQVAADADFTDLVMDLTVGAETTLTVSNNQLPSGLPLYARLSYTDANLTASAFSSAVEFQLAVPSNFQQLLSENFDGLELGPFVDEAGGDGTDWTKTPPPGWTIDDSGVPANGGVTEWKGWSFADVDAWAEVAGDQDRTLFTSGRGAVAIADPDEWDDIAHDEGTYNTNLISPSISLAGMDAGAVMLAFNSSWRPEDDQQVEVTLSYDGGENQELLYWNSFAGDPNFKPDATSELVVLPLNNPAGASQLVITWGMFNAGNDWWWAIDNIIVYADTGTPVDNWSVY